jgi:hypothetical protein
MASFEGLGSAGALCPHCKRLIPPRRVRGVRHWETWADYMRDLRVARRRDGICTRCGVRRAMPGYARCGSCNRDTARTKRMGRQIGTKTCGCGRPAIDVYYGEYICAECKKIEHKQNAPRDGSQDTVRADVGSSNQEGKA